MSNLPLDRESLVAATVRGATFDYLFFWGHRKPDDGTVSKPCFSQWYEAAFTDAGERYKTAEHYMMVHKARLFGDEASARKALAAATPGEAKSIGRKVSGFSEELWLSRRDQIVVTANMLKFSQNINLRRFLVRTCDTILVEASPLDSIWGIGVSQDDPRANRPGEWPGLNLLGFALMRVRDQLKDGAW